MVYYDQDDRAGLRDYVQLSKHTHTLSCNKPGSVHAHRTEVTRSEEREGANIVWDGIGLGGGIVHGNAVGGDNGDVNSDGGGTGARMRTKVEVNEGTRDGSGDGSGNGNEDWAGTGTGTGVDTCQGTQDKNGNGSGDGNESCRGHLNWDKNGNGDGNEVGISKDGGEVNERKKPYTTCRRDQPFSFRTRHHLCRQGVVLAGTRQLRSQGPVSVNAHRTEGVTGCVGREETNGVMGVIKVGGGNGYGNGVGSGNGHVDVSREGHGAGTRTGVETNEGTQYGNKNGRRAAG